MGIPEYRPVKALLLPGLVGVGWIILLPIRTPSHLAVRRPVLFLVIAFAAFGILFAGLVNRVAWAIGVNQLLYVLALAFFAQVATAYRRDAQMERKLTDLARAVALAGVREAPADARVTTGREELGRDAPAAGHEDEAGGFGTASRSEPRVQARPTLGSPG